MNKIYFYNNGDNPIKYFWRKNCKPTENFCFFSTRRKSLEHYYIQHNTYDMYNFDTNEDCKWGRNNIWIVDNDEVTEFIPTDKLSCEILEEFYKRTKGDSIIEVELDKYE